MFCNPVSKIKRRYLSAFERFFEEDVNKVPQKNNQFFYFKQKH